MEKAALIAAAIVVALMFILVFKTVRIVPQARARNIERFGRYRKTLEPGMNFIIPFVDRLKPLIDLREQVVAFKGQPVITEDNLVVLIDTVLFFQITDPRAADYEIVNYIQAIEQITVTMLRSVIGSMDLEQTLTSRDKINTMLRGVLDEASGKWGIRVTRVEIKTIEPPKSVVDAMEKQMRAEREKRAAILTAEGLRQSKILTAEGEKQSSILRAEGDRESQILRAEGEAQQTKRMSLLLTLSPTSLDRDRGDAQRQSAVDPVAVVDGQDELIGNPVELARIMRDLVRVEKVEREG